jgi:hypothetical protein
MPDEASIAYFTALWEAEGWVSVSTRPRSQSNPNGNNGTITLAISMSDREPMILAGGGIGFGTFNGVPRIQNERKPMYTLHISGFESVQYVVALMWKRLSPRRKHQLTEALAKYHSQWTPPPRLHRYIAPTRFGQTYRNRTHKKNRREPK